MLTLNEWIVMLASYLITFRISAYLSDTGSPPGGGAIEGR